MEFVGVIILFLFVIVPIVAIITTFVNASSIASLREEIKKLNDKVEKASIDVKKINLEKSGQKAVVQMEQSVEQEDNKIILQQENKTLKEEIIKQEPVIKSEETKIAELIKDLNNDKQDIDFSNKHSDKLEKPNFEQKSEINFEKLLMGNLFNKIGAIILIIAFLVFIKLTGFEFSPLAKILITYFCATGICAFSIKLFNENKKTNMQKYAQILWGLGISVYFISTFVASSYFKIMPMGVTVTIGTILIGLTYFISEKYKIFSAFLIGILGGYLTPFFVYEGLDVNFLAWYLIFLNLIGIAYTIKNADKMSFNILNLIASTITLGALGLFSYTKIMIVIPVILWLIYFFNDLYINIRAKNDFVSDVLNWINLIVLIIFTSAKGSTLTVATLLMCGLIYFLSYIFVSKISTKQKAMIYLYNSIITVIGATFFLSQEIIRTCVYSIEMVLISFGATLKGCEKLQKFPLIFTAIIFLTIFMQGDLIFNNYQHIFSNERTVLLLVPAICLLLSSYIIRKFDAVSKMLIFYSLSLLAGFIIILINYSKMMPVNSIRILQDQVGFMYVLLIARLYNATRQKGYFFVTYVAYFLFLMLLILNSYEFNSQNILAFLNVRFLTYMVAIGVLWQIEKIAKALNDFASHAYVVIPLIACCFESLLLADNLNVSNSGIVLSILLSIYSFVLMIWGILKNKSLQKKYGIAILIFAMVKILSIDLHNAQIEERFFAFLIVGLILLLVSYFYTKKTGN